MSKEMSPTVLMIMICLRCALGGAEKRYARVFEHLIDQPDSRHKLLINRTMLRLLQAGGVLRNHKAHLIVLDPPSERIRWLARRRRLASLIDSVWYVQQCWRVIGSMRPQVVHPLLTGVYLSLPALMLRPGLCRVMSAYSYQFESYRDRRFFGHSLGAMVKRWAMEHANMLEALSDSIRQDLIARGLDSSRIWVAPGSFTDLSFCLPAVEKRRWVVFAGRFVDIKNPLLLVEALPAVVESHPDIHLFFLGDGVLEREIQCRVHELGLDAYVTMRFEPQPTKVLNESSIFVSLQSEENYPSQSLLEAMACGNAVVATDVGETWRLVDETTGVRVSPTSAAVAGAINQLLDDPALPQRQHAARQRVLAEHTPERFFAYIDAVYQHAFQVRS